MVSPATRDAGGQASSTTNEQFDIDQPSEGISPPGPAGQASTSHMASIRNSLQVQGVSEQAIKIISASWRRGTEKSYSSAWRKWSSWCHERNCDPLSAPLNQVLDFLPAEFKNGKEYSTLISYQSAISSAHNLIDGQPVGRNAVVCRLLQGVFNKRPPQPYSWCEKGTLSTNRHILVGNTTCRVLFSNYINFRKGNQTCSVVVQFNILDMQMQMYSEYWNTLVSNIQK